MDETADEPARETETAQPTNDRFSRWQLVFGATGAVVAVLTVTFGALTFFGLNRPATSPGAPSSTSTVAASTTTPAAPAVPSDLFDDFAGPTIDPAKWGIDDDRQVFSQSDGGLYASVQSPGNATLTARPGHAVTSVGLTARILSASGKGDGGVYVILVGSGGQRRVVLGVGRDQDTVGFRVESCPDVSCATVEHPLDRLLQAGTPYPVTIAVQRDHTTVRVGGFPPIDLDPIGTVSEARIYESSGTGSTYQVEIDGVRLGST